MSQTWSGKSLKKATDRNGVRIILSSVSFDHRLHGCH